MAYTPAQLTILDVRLQPPPGSATLRQWAVYFSAADSIASIQAAAYFNGARDVLRTGDLVSAVGSDGSCMLEVDSAPPAGGGNVAVSLKQPIGPGPVGGGGGSNGLIEFFAFVAGAPDGDAILGAWQPSTAVSLDESRCYATAATPAAYGAVFTVLINGSEAGQVTFEASAGAASVSLFATDLATGDMLSIVAPPTVLGEVISDINFTLAGARGLASS